MEKFNFEGYARLLSNWVEFSQRHLYYYPEKEGLICYGTGAHQNWGVQTHAKAMTAFATVACMKEIDLSAISLSREQILAQALGLLRYSLHTHLVGDTVCTDGGKWGHNWIYALTVERMFHAIEMLWEYMSDEDKALLRALMLSESDYLLNEEKILAGLVENNKPESNIWNGALLYRTAVLYPDAPNKDLYMEKAYRFFANGISIEDDENSDEVVGGKRIGDLFVGANMFNSYACNHHGYLNIGYMYICISNIAMLHFFLKSRNIKPHPIIYHNLKSLWRLVRATTFDDGRLFRIGGDSRARYCYCQDYALPSWQLIEDALDEDCTELENEWLKILEQETCINGDGSFLSNRFGYVEDISPLYYTRLESDRANTISMALYWHKKFPLESEGKPDRLTQWEDAYHGAAFVATGERFAAFTWRASELPQGSIAPKNNSSLVEWRHNLCGSVVGPGLYCNDEVEDFSLISFNGGFLTSGSTLAFSDRHFGEGGQPKEYLARKKIAFAALPDESTVLCLQYAEAINRMVIAESAGIFWNVPNDIYNGQKRRIDSEKGPYVCRGGARAKRNKVRPLGAYACVDGQIGIASAEPLLLVRRNKRQVDIKGNPDSGTLYCEEICTQYRDVRAWVERGSVLFDTGFAVSLGDTAATAEMSRSIRHFAVGDIKAVSVSAKDKKTYILIANFGKSEASVSSEALRVQSARNVCSGEAVKDLSLEPMASLLLQCETLP